MVRPGFEITAEPPVEPTGNVRRVIEISEKYLSTILIDLTTQKLISLRNYSLLQTPDATPVQEIMDILNNEDESIDFQYTARVIYNYTESALLPSQLYSSQLEAPLTRVVFGDAERGATRTDTIPEMNIEHIYRVARDVNMHLEQRFPQAEHRHIYSQMIPLYISGAEVDNETDVIKVEFYSDRFILLIFRNNDLKAINTYLYQTPEDVVYYMLGLCQKLEVDPAAAVTHISGLIDVQSPLFTELNKYFARVIPEALPEPIRQQQLVNEYPDHYFANLMNLALCE